MVVPDPLVVRVANVHSCTRVSEIVEKTGVAVLMLTTAFSLKVLISVGRVPISPLFTVPKVIDPGRVPGVT